MIVCSCNVVSDKDVREVLGAKADRPSVGAVFRRMGFEPKCGRCARNIVAVVDQHLAAEERCDICRKGEQAA